LAVSSGRFIACATALYKARADGEACRFLI
jgi:hypothetical protein